MDFFIRGFQIGLSLAGFFVGVYLVIVLCGSVANLFSRWKEVSRAKREAS
jgi:hypothetical protein